MTLDHLYPDPTKDVAGVIGMECFLCGKKIVDPRREVTFRKTPSPSGVEYPELPCHRTCIQGTPPRFVELEYLSRCADGVGAKRPR